MQIEKMIIKNFKAFKEKIINFKCEKNGKTIIRNFLLIVGDNGSGKSTILEAIHLCLTGYYRGKPIVGNISQDLFNKDCVDSYIKDFNENKNPELPKISIEIFFDDEPILEGDYNSTKSRACGLTFEISYDSRNDEAYKELNGNKPLSTLPFEFYKCEWNTFARKQYTNSKFIQFKSAYLNTNVDRVGNTSSNRLIRSYIDDSAKIKLNQSYRNISESFKDSDSIRVINNKIKDCDELKTKNITIGLTNMSQNSWENAITIKENDIPYENIGTGNQCIVNTILSFENELFKNKGIILIEEPENHLSGMNLNKLLVYIQNHSSDYQVLISTHSSFVLNKLGMDNLLLISENQTTSFENLSEDTVHYFNKVSGFDTLRFILSKKVILVEGDSDDLIVQRAYLDCYNKLPINSGIEIIDVGLSYKRFLELSKELQIDTVVITDNDGNKEKILNLKKEYEQFTWIKICSGEKVFEHSELGLNDKVIPNINTLEPEILRANNRTVLNKIFGKKFDSDEKLLHYMITNKTECAWEIFNYKEKIRYPKYILDAIGYNFEEQAQ